MIFGKVRLVLDSELTLVLNNKVPVKVIIRKCVMSVMVLYLVYN